MPIPAIPDPLVSAIGGDVLPIEANTPSGSGALSYAQGWPVLTGLPLEAGGIAPQREFFNAVNSLFSQHLFFIQSGGVYPWRDALNYLTGWRVLVGGQEYTALSPSGPDIPDVVGVVGPKPPATSPEYWKTTEVTVAAATETVAGIVELATVAEATAGTDATRAVTPAGLAARTATATRAGIVELATVAEATTGTDATRAVTPQGLAAAIAATVIVAPGEIIAFAASTAPTGYLKCNGAAVSRTTYASLFAVVGTTFGAGNGSTTFNLPDLRGEFVRGWDDGRGVDTGRVIGSAQGDAIRNITGTLAYQDDGLPAAVQTATGAFAATPAISTTILNGSAVGGNYSISAKLDVSLVVPTAPENRPRNVAVLYCIKY